MYKYFSNRYFPILLVLYMIFTSCENQNNQVIIKTNTLSAINKELGKNAKYVDTKFVFYKNSVVITSDLLGFNNERISFRKGSEVDWFEKEDAFFIDGFPIKSNFYIFGFYCDKNLLGIKFIEITGNLMLKGESDVTIIFGLLEEENLVQLKCKEIESFYNINIK